MIVIPLYYRVVGIFGRFSEEVIVDKFLKDHSFGFDYVINLFI